MNQIFYNLFWFIWQFELVTAAHGIIFNTKITITHHTKTERT